MELDLIRKEISEVDLEILSLMKKRLELAKMVGENKALTGDAVRNIPSENRVIDRYRGFALENRMNPVYSEAICRILMQESIDLQASLPRKASSIRHIAIIGGCGKMGRWMADTFTSAGHRVDVIDPSAGNGLTVDDCKWADTAIVSIPISRTGDMLEKIDSIAKEDALIFDIASLKSPFISILKDLATKRHICSVHPMFGPSAGSMYDRNLLICNCGDTAAVDQAESLFRNHGANIRIMPVDEHDKYMSYVLGLSHAINIAFFTVLQRSGIDFEDMKGVASTTYNKLLESNMSVALEDPYLYYEIQHLNSNRESMLKEFNESVNDVVNAALADDPSSFKKLMDAGRSYFT